ncbi:MAG: ribosome small subunit-dependent GTPase A [Leptospirales bacterium]|nr:ribosome small subunit-dependent GTPase A [Leptospirales bacterium]
MQARCASYELMTYRGDGRERPMSDPLALISCVYGAYYSLLCLPELTTEYRARPRGRLRLPHAERESRADFRERHRLAVGDEVRYALPPGEKEAWITDLLPRRNVLYRGAGRELQSLGANLDLALVVLSLASPPPRWGFVDRFLASASEAGVPAGIVFTKTDQIAEDSPDIEVMIEVYRKLCYPVWRLDARGGAQWQPVLEELKSRLCNCTTLLAGHSGAGKSTLLNSLAGRPLQRIGEISAATGKGRHTTTNAALHLFDRCRLIDTPGVREWGIHHLSREQILLSFPELRSLADECEFHDCQHLPESRGCQLQQRLQLSRQRALDYYQDPEREDAALEQSLPPFEAELVHPERYHSLALMLSNHGLIDRIRMGDYIRATGRVRSGKLRGFQGGE